MEDGNPVAMIVGKMVSDQGLVTARGISQGALQNRLTLFLPPSLIAQESTAIHQENCL